MYILRQGSDEPRIVYTVSLQVTIATYIHTYLSRYLITCRLLVCITSHNADYRLTGTRLCCREIQDSSKELRLLTTLLLCTFQISGKNSNPIL